MRVSELQKGAFKGPSLASSRDSIALMKKPSKAPVKKVKASSGSLASCNNKDLAKYDAWQQLKMFQRSMSIDKESKLFIDEHDEVRKKKKSHRKSDHRIKKSIEEDQGFNREKMGNKLPFDCKSFEGRYECSQDSLSNSGRSDEYGNRKNGRSYNEIRCERRNTEDEQFKKYSQPSLHGKQLSSDEDYRNQKRRTENKSHKDVMASKSKVPRHKSFKNQFKSSQDSLSCSEQSEEYENKKNGRAFNEIRCERRNAEDDQFKKYSQSASHDKRGKLMSSDEEYRHQKRRSENKSHNDVMGLQSKVLRQKSFEAHRKSCQDLMPEERDKVFASDEVGRKKKNSNRNTWHEEKLKRNSKLCKQNSFEEHPENVIGKIMQLSSFDEESEFSSSNKVPQEEKLTSKESQMNAERYKVLHASNDGRTKKSSDSNMLNRDELKRNSKPCRQTSFEEHQDNVMMGRMQLSSANEGREIASRNKVPQEEKLTPKEWQMSADRVEVFHSNDDCRTKQGGDSIMLNRDEMKRNSKLYRQSSFEEHRENVMIGRMQLSSANEERGSDKLPLEERLTANPKQQRSLEGGSSGFLRVKSSLPLHQFDEGEKKVQRRASRRKRDKRRKRPKVRPKSEESRPCSSSTG